jgi:hypothetical protein
LRRGKSGQADQGEGRNGPTRKRHALDAPGCGASRRGCRSGPLRRHNRYAILTGCHGQHENRP